MSKKLASPAKSLNYIASEMAILLERAQIQRLVPQHIPGKFNQESDWLSRLGDRGDMPASLKGQGATDFRTVSTPHGDGTTWISRKPLDPWRAKPNWGL
eukprot:s2755_g4.t1